MHVITPVTCTRRRTQPLKVKLWPASLHDSERHHVHHNLAPQDKCAPSNTDLKGNNRNKIPAYSHQRKCRTNSAAHGVTSSTSQCWESHCLPPDRPANAHGTTTVCTRACQPPLSVCTQAATRPVVPCLYAYIWRLVHTCKAHQAHLGARPHAIEPLQARRRSHCTASVHKPWP